MNTHFALDPQKYVNLPSYAVSTNCRAAVGSTGQINSLSSDQVCQCILCVDAQTVGDSACIGVLTVV